MSFLTCLTCVFVILFVTSVCGAPTLAVASEMKNKTREYLDRFGYMYQVSKPIPGIEAIEDPTEGYKQGLKLFQAKWKLNVTGELDEHTMALLTTPRCGVSDMQNAADVPAMAGRRKRYTFFGGTWPSLNITYSIQYDTTVNSLTPSQVKSIINKALIQWQSVSPLRFIEKPFGATGVNIPMEFRAKLHEDGQSNAFDGAGGVLAHAFNPPYGDTHFDKDETWTDGTNAGTNLLQVATHELGHALGLGHSDISSAVMAPFYTAYDPNFKLNSDDIAAIQARYGPPPTASAPGVPSTTPSKTSTTPVLAPNQPSTTPSPSTTTSVRSTTPTKPYYEPLVCQDKKIDAITEISVGGKSLVYAFRGDEYVQILSTGIAPGFPRKIAADWKGAPSYVEAILTYPAKKETQLQWVNGAFVYKEKVVIPSRTFFIKNSTFWCYLSDTKEPLPTANCSVPYASTNLPPLIQAAFVWSGNGRAYVMTAKHYYRLQQYILKVETGYPKDLAVWGLKSAPDDAFSITHFESAIVKQSTYFVLGNELYTFDDVAFKIEDGPPRSLVADILRCSPAHNAVPNGQNETANSSPSSAVVQRTLILISLTFLSHFTS